MKQTRCECKQRRHDGHAIDNSDYCVRPPVRTVMVTERVDCSGQLIDGGKVKPISIMATHTVPMCAPCAAYHEARQKA